MSGDVACDELAYARAPEVNSGRVEAATLFVGIYVPKRHRADGTQRPSLPVEHRVYCESSAEKTSIGRPGVNITSGI
jgi:hypothetical protein